MLALININIIMNILIKNLKYYKFLLDLEVSKLLVIWARTILVVCYE